MKTVLQNLNRLPTPTWRWLGVNQAVFEGEVPDIQPLQAGAVPDLPVGVSLLEDTQEFDVVSTGVGESAVAFVQRHSNAHSAFCVGKNKVVAAPLVYRYALETNNPAVVDETLLLAENNSQITVVQLFTSQDASSHFHAGLTRIIAKAGAQVRLIQVQALNDASTALCNVGVHVEGGATVQVVQVELGANQSFAGCNAVLRESMAQLDVETFYLGDASRKLDFNYVVQHVAPHTTCKMGAAGALFDHSEKIYRGTIDFVRGAQRSVGHQQENVVLFSPHARNRSVPLILCGEENVEGQHAATIGKVDKAKEFYLQSRGLLEQQVKMLMVEAQFAPVLAALPDDVLRAEVSAMLAERIENR